MYFSDRVVALHMPKTTFINLSPERQREIIDVAYKEFILNDYKSASLSNIIKQLSLAKGSFYRYFNSKKELYLFLLDEATKERFNTLEKRLSDPKTDLFTLLLDNWHDKIEFEKNHTLESAFQYRVFRERYNEELGDIEITLKKELTHKVTELIKSRFQHSIRNNIDPYIIAFIIVQVQVGLFDYFTLRYNDDLLENIRQGKSLYTIHQKDIEHIIESFITILKNGIAYNSAS